MTMNGIDISNWQHGLDLDKVQFDFMIAKATEGISFVDPTCDKFIQQAKKQGKPWGFYHFARPDKNDAVTEARYFYAHTRNYFGEGIPILDWEYGPTGNVNWALTWLQEIERLSGIKPMIYMNEYTENSYNWDPVVKNNNGLWIAKYANKAPQFNYSVYGTPPKTKHWRGYAMWQWTGTGRLSGYQTFLDCNVFYGNAEAWKKYATSAKSTKKYYAKIGPFATKEEAAKHGGEVIEE